MDDNMWNGLQNFGFATMAAGAQPGATLAGSMGQGGMYATDMAKQQALQQAQIQQLAAQTQGQHLNNRMTQLNIDMMSNPGAMFGDDTQGSPNPSAPPANNAGMSFAPTAGSSPPMKPGAMNSYMPSLVNAESSGNPNAVSPKGAQGLTQIMPATGSNPGYGVAPLQNNSTQEQLRFGADYLNAMGDRYKEPRMALAAYNAGPDTVDRALSSSGGDPNAAFQKLPAVTQQYVHRVISATAQQGGTSASPSPGAPNVPINRAALRQAFVVGMKEPRLGAEILRQTQAPAVAAAEAAAKLPYEAKLNEVKERGKHAEDAAAKLDEDSNSAQKQNFLISQMQNEMQGWDQNSVANWEGTYRAHAQALRQTLGLPDDPDLDKPLGNYQAFQKNSMQLLTAATKETSQKAAFQEMLMIQKALPQATMSKDGLQSVFTQMHAMNDYTLAKQQAMQQWRDAHDGSVVGFEPDFKQRISSPAPFLFNRMDKFQFHDVALKLQQTKEGREMLAKSLQQQRYAKDHNLFVQE